MSVRRWVENGIRADKAVRAPGVLLLRSKTEIFSQPAKILPNRSEKAECAVWASLWQRSSGQRWLMVCLPHLLAQARAALAAVRQCPSDRFAIHDYVIAVSDRNRAAFRAFLMLLHPLLQLPPSS